MIEAVNAIQKRLIELEKEIVRRDVEGTKLIKKAIVLEDNLNAVLAKMVSLEKKKVFKAKITAKEREKLLAAKAAELESKKHDFQKKQDMLKQMKERTLSVKQELKNIELHIQKETQELYTMGEVKKEVKKAAPMLAAKPVAKPAPKPIAKPVAKPIAKPVAKPIPKLKPLIKKAPLPVSKPIPKPAAKPVPKLKLLIKKTPMSKPASKPLETKTFPILKQKLFQNWLQCRLLWECLRKKHLFQAR